MFIFWSCGAPLPAGRCQSYYLDPGRESGLLAC
jgi:hypothetical protein